MTPTRPSHRMACAWPSFERARARRARRRTSSSLVRDGSDALVVTPAPSSGDHPSSTGRTTRRRCSWVPGPLGDLALRCQAGSAAARHRDRRGHVLQPFQPPSGSAILSGGTAGGHPTLVRLELDTGRETVLPTGSSATILDSARWSPDGSKVLYNSSPATGDSASQRLFIVNADGTGRRQITDAPDTGSDIDGTWSPRWQPDRVHPLRTRHRCGHIVGRPTDRPLLAGDRSVVDLGPLPRDARAKDPNPATPPRHVERASTSSGRLTASRSSPSPVRRPPIRS